ncbi:type II toxin-antitoxin system VapB family antitoxin [Algoriphagus sp. D3-2-R+10]|uniref:type II toxin-antitoxin system VapB family antitoxin n=1 Tax=Algoriphagus aurantiacus TaxID=3103948 RepID=UPI002B3F4D6E|nr:type II toxin-antitoxin system VapB family antitoxin [Algoriphagus sp. D3-2-R+10]MEB2777726.1 type II toxin-antitoxin system VapB family antitoxin [Algoriphagus sp. D3-2-R+10]
MKVTALIEDELIQDVMEISGAKNITEALRIALKDYRSRKLMRNYSDSIAAEPLEFTYGARQIRDLNQE